MLFLVWFDSSRNILVQLLIWLFGPGTVAGRLYDH